LPQRLTGDGNFHDFRQMKQELDGQAI
jgi:hypothetical protein